MPLACAAGGLDERELTTIDKAISQASRFPNPHQQQTSSFPIRLVEGIALHALGLQFGKRLLGQRRIPTFIC